LHGDAAVARAADQGEAFDGAEAGGEVAAELAGTDVVVGGIFRVGYTKKPSTAKPRRKTASLPRHHRL